MDRSIYFIGGTYGASSGVWIAVLAATLTAIGAFAVGWFIEDYKRHRDRQALAAALRSEITVIIQLFRELSILENYRNLQAVLQDALRGGHVSLPGVPADAMTFPTTVYEKCADRVGTLGVREADGVVRFYNFLNGFRVVARLAIQADVPLQGRIASLDFMLNLIESERQTTERLRGRLQAVADRPWRPFS